MRFLVARAKSITMPYFGGEEQSEKQRFFREETGMTPASFLERFDK
jgi:hypothetical protein